MRSIIFNALFWGLAALFALLCYALSFLPWRAPLLSCMIGFCRSARFCLRYVAGVPIDVRGVAPKAQPVILAAKHQSYADGPMMMAIIGDINFVIGNAIEKFPLINRIVARSGATMVNSQGNTQAPGALEAAIKRSHGEDRPLLIYPEGGLAAIGETKRYRKGIFMMYQTLDREVVPVATNLGLRWNQDDWHKTPGPAVVEFLDPIPSGLPREIFMQRLQEAIESKTRELEAEGQAFQEQKA
ncbi:MAG: 1-acyl-sn-glycerol-3-phosphate acyltransferase [Alphaproteobacteria bacterium]|nr:1-acyl-sn-glycerol-3-phosphate acyltransferase [Alphaproteobacteria bacterium]